MGEIWIAVRNIKIDRERKNERRRVGGIKRGMEKYGRGIEI